MERWFLGLHGEKRTEPKCLAMYFLLIPVFHSVKSYKKTLEKEEGKVFYISP